ncbi:hypothetical protein IRJ41_008232, partial [Triplophysa rosa]
SHGGVNVHLCILLFNRCAHELISNLHSSDRWKVTLTLSKHSTYVLVLYHPFMINLNYLKCIVLSH